MNKYLWNWIFTFGLFLLWSLGGIAAARNNDISYKDTWVGIIYLILGLLLIITGLLFWIKGVEKTLSSENDGSTSRKAP